MAPFVGISQTPTQNYVKEQVYLDATTKVANPLTHSSVSYFDGLGRTTQVIQTGSASHVYGENNLIPWPQEWTEGSGPTPSFNMYGLENENTRERMIDPFGDFSVVWKCGPGLDEQSPGYDSDGGSTTDYFSIDSNQTYRYAVWVKRKGGIVGHSYVGSGGNSSIEELNGTPSPYGYFWSGDTPDEDWYLVVGMIHPEGYAGGETGISGLYNTLGEKISDGTGYRFAAGANYARLRMYYVSGNSPTDFRYFYGPLIQALDGTEIPLEDLFKKPSATYPDIIVPMEYDQFGRQTKEYLPYSAPSEQGHIHTDPFTDQLAFYDDVKYDNTLNPYSEKILESSPLGRVLEIGAPGASWAANPTSDDDHTIKLEYRINSTDEVARFEVALNVEEINGVITYHPELHRSDNYPAAVLMKNVTKDENWTPLSGNNHTTEEFTNKSGQVVLKRAYNDGEAPDTYEAHDTYYVYDDYGNLTYVLPPAVDTSDPVTQEILNVWCYQYTYDHSNRMVAKKLPGKGIEYIVYNKLDQPILTQDARQRAQNQWLFAKYDKFGRTVYTGIYNDTHDRLHHQEAVNNETISWEAYAAVPENIGGTLENYTNTTYPNATDLELHTIAYYDTYEFTGAGADIESFGVTPTSNVKGMATGSKVRVLGTPYYVITTLFYDEKRQVISSHQQNDYQNTEEEVTNQLDFLGKTLASQLTHSKDGELTTIDRTYTYDPQNQLVSIQLSVNGEAAQEIFHQEYDDLGRLIRKDLHTDGSESEAEMAFDYNIRGWLTNTTDQGESNLFTMELAYDQASTPLYNGNIGTWNWETNGNGLQTYDYGYDALNRITSGVKNGGTHSLNAISYDKMGNILSLDRSGSDGANNIDELTYNYQSGNQLEYVTDGSTDTLGFNDRNTMGCDYAYDGNGNLIEDRNKKIDSIHYNHLNLPTGVFFDGEEEIHYTYDATGIKLKREVVTVDTTMTTNYAGSFIYENDKLQLIQHEEGRIVPKYAGQPEVLESWDYQYHLKDHLGNVRLTFSTTPENYTATAQFEDATLETDTVYFGNVDTPNRVDHPSITNTGKASRLNNTTPAGPFAVISINKRDTISLSVNAYYEGGSGYTSSIDPSFFETALAGAFNTSQTLIEGGVSATQINSGVAAAIAALGVGGSSDDNVPGAYLNYLVFDRDMNYQNIAGFVQISNAANMSEETISIDEIIADREGYIIAYLSNESNSTDFVHFDDFTIYHGKTNVVQTDDYMPFGMAYNSISRTGSSPQKFKYNGKESQEELGLNWLDYGARNYDAALGRWMNMDPLTEKYHGYSPFNYVTDNPINAIDPDGRDVYFLLFNTSKGNDGHTMIAIDNYVEKPKRDKDGQVILDENGVVVNEMVKDGTITIFDFGPLLNPDEKKPPGFFNFVDGEYDAQIMPKELILENNQTDADGVLEIVTSYETDQEVIKALVSHEFDNQEYNKLWSNCTDFTKVGLEAALGRKINGEETVGLFFRVTTPFKVYRDVRNDSKVNEIENPGPVVEKRSAKAYRGN